MHETNVPPIVPQIIPNGPLIMSQNRTKVVIAAEHSVGYATHSTHYSLYLTSSKCTFCPLSTHTRHVIPIQNNWFAWCAIHWNFWWAKFAARPQHRHAHKSTHICIHTYMYFFLHSHDSLVPCRDKNYFWHWLALEYSVKFLWRFNSLAESSECQQKISY